MHGMLRGMTARPDAPAPVTVIAGEEELLVERSVGALITAARLAQEIRRALRPGNWPR